MGVEGAVSPPRCHEQLETPSVGRIHDDARDMNLGVLADFLPGDELVHGRPSVALLYGIDFMSTMFAPARGLGVSLAQRRPVRRSARRTSRVYRAVVLCRASPSHSPSSPARPSEGRSTR